MTMNHLELIKKNHEQLIELEKLSIANDNQTLEIHKLKEHIDKLSLNLKTKDKNVITK